MKAKITEADLAATVARYLEGEGWDYFAEVQVEQGDRRADLVATLGRRLMVIETKLSLSIDVLSQALNWLPRAHHVVIAVPDRKDTSVDSSRMTFVVEFLKRYGIGLWFVDTTHANRPIHEIVRPHMHRYADAVASRIREVLVAEMRDDVAGSKTPGKASSPFKRTCLNLRRYVERNPGERFEDAMNSIPHHYGSARSARSSLEFILKFSGLAIRHGRLYVEGTEVESEVKPSVPPPEEFALTPPVAPSMEKLKSAENSAFNARRPNVILLRCQACRLPILIADRDKMGFDDYLGDSVGVVRRAYQFQEDDRPYTLEYHRAVDMQAQTLCTCSGK